MRPFRGRRIAMIFQNPQSSINPVFTLGEQIFRLIRMFLPDEIKTVQQRLKCSARQAVRQIAKEKLEEVGLTDVERLFKAYAHQISGGMAQRYRIATALLSSPEVLIADEATSALDVTVQAHILKLLRSLCRRKGTAIVFITHDLGIAAQMCDRVAVMYSGRIVETAPTLIHFRITAAPLYTRAPGCGPPARQRQTTGQYTRHDSGPGQSARRVSFSPPLPACHGMLQKGKTASAGYRQTASGRLLSLSVNKSRIGRSTIHTSPRGRVLAEAIIHLNQVKTHFPYRKNFWGQPTQWVRAVDGVNLQYLPASVLDWWANRVAARAHWGAASFAWHPWFPDRSFSTKRRSRD